MKLLVRNLARTTTQADILALFEAHGTVESCTLVMDAKTGQSKGFGFVEMANQREGETAIAELDGFLFNGRNLRVNMARPRTQRPRRRSNDWY